MLNHSSILKFLPLSSYCPKLPPCIISANNFFPSFSFGSHSNHGPSLISNRSSVINTCSPPSSACGPPFPPHIPREQHHQSKIINQPFGNYVKPTSYPIRLSKNHLMNTHLIRVYFHLQIHNFISERRNPIDYI